MGALTKCQNIIYFQFPLWYKAGMKLAKLAALPHPHTCSYIIIWKNERVQGGYDKQRWRRTNGRCRGELKWRKVWRDTEGGAGEKGEMWQDFWWKEVGPYKEKKGKWKTETGIGQTQVAKGWLSEPSAGICTDRSLPPIMLVQLA